MERYARIIGLKAESIEEYERLHADAWPGLLKTIRECNIHNYSIYRYGTLLFAYLEYLGTNFEADMAHMAEDPVTQAWWKLTDPMQEGMPDRQPGEWWMRIPEVFHVD
jgi:L-rhamnose mutarotase